MTDERHPADSRARRPWRIPRPNLSWCDDSPLWPLGFRYYAPTARPWDPLVILGFEVEAASVEPATAAPSWSEGWCGPVLSPLAWRSTRRDMPMLRVLHQCGGAVCLQRAVVGVPLRPTSAARDALSAAVYALDGDEPTLTQVAKAAAALPPGLSIDRSFRRCVASFLVMDVPDAAGRALRPLFESELPDDVASLFLPRPDVLDAVGRRAPDIDASGLCLFALGENED